jgi:hypothetical protein
MTLRCKLRYYPRVRREVERDVEFDAVVHPLTVVIPYFPDANFQAGGFFAIEVDGRVELLTVTGPPSPLPNPDGTGVQWHIPITRDRSNTIIRGAISEKSRTQLAQLQSQPLPSAADQPTDIQPTPD